MEAQLFIVERRGQGLIVEATLKVCGRDVLANGDLKRLDGKVLGGHHRGAQGAGRDEWACGEICCLG